MTKKDKLKTWMVRLAAFGPIAYIVVDSIAHAFGICLGLR